MLLTGKRILLCFWFLEEMSMAYCDSRQLWQLFFRDTHILSLLIYYIYILLIINRLWYKNRAIKDMTSILFLTVTLWLWLQGSLSKAFSSLFMKLRSIDILLASAESEQAPLCIQLGRMFLLTSYFICVRSLTKKRLDKRNYSSAISQALCRRCAGEQVCKSRVLLHFYV